MDYTRFIQMLLEETDRRNPVEEKRIMTFLNPRHYFAYHRELNRLKASGIKLPHVHSSHLIKSIIAPVSARSKFALRYKDLLLLEDNRSIKVHAVQSKIDTNPGIPYGVKQIHAPRAWSTSTGHRIKIGVIDTGVDFQHPDLRHSLSGGINLLNRNMLPLDDNGHGTHIAGTIAAANSTEGMIGVAPRSIIYPVKAFDHNGSAYVSDIILGIDWCVRNHVHLINMSFGMKTRSRALQEIVNKAYLSGISIVASSGNDGKRRTIDYPARYSQTISVGATDQNRRIAPFSNRGQYIDIYAPGDKIISSWTHGKYHEMSGTSMATSHVSGAIALLLAQNSSLQPAEIKTLLQRTSTPLRLRKDQRLERDSGEVNALQLLREGMKLTTTGAEPVTASLKAKKNRPSKI
ncbi:S8 family peptidase [Paenibacillus macquariensis]|uniref:Subtilase family protein n=1 Tax=Paenibacillus macquariensis TaxID=948756 RepID=A0ABY1KD47_9BACL|nr:S8 family peptidase [Paenibacillus macquariensis]MEC0093378.1 S8 family peptidase [Paenibacillus macquariensis]SIR63420.1 Subtilase family protein [Paenibacillus macquariensis]